MSARDAGTSGDEPEETTQPDPDTSEGSVRHLRLGWLLLAASLLLLGAAWFVPLVLRDDPSRGWWGMVAAGALLVLLGGTSLLVLVHRRRGPDSTPAPLERPEPPPIDFDAPWHEEERD